jgi:small subunit ribosomal protein S3Ae
MTAGKNPRNFKKKGLKKKSVHPFTKKEWYKVNVPSIFDVATPTLTPCNKTAGQKVSGDSLRGRVFEINQADLAIDANEQKELAWRKVRLQVEEVKNFDLYTNFYGIDTTRDQLCALIKKWHTLIEAFAQARTTDGYLLRMFCIAFTKRSKRQVKATTYAKNSQQKLIRQKMQEILVAECQKSTLKDLFKKFLSDDIGQQISQAASKFYPLENVIIRKVKVLKKPKFDLTKLMELYQSKAEVMKPVTTEEAKK